MARNSLVCLCALAALCCRLAHTDHNEYILYNDLLKNYTRLERPVANSSDAVVVRIGLVLQQIINVDEKNQIIEVNAWIKYTWRDYKLVWDPSRFGGVTDVRFPVDVLWKPDVLVYNSADSAFDTTYPSNIVVYNDGSILWIPPGILRTSCKIDIRWFPFDDQSCHIKFGSWTYHGDALDLRPESPKTGADTSEYMTNGEWLLLSAPVVRNLKYYECCPEPYIDVKFFLNIRRRTLYYGFNLIIPSLLISLMTVLGFTLPPDAGEKITLEITILLSVCFFLSIVADMTPPTSEAVPLIGTFFTCCMVVVSASVVFTVVVLNLHYRTPDTHAMSPVCRTVLLNWLPWMLMMRRPGHVFEPPPLVNWAIQLSRKRGLFSRVGGQQHEHLVEAEKMPPEAFASPLMPHGYAKPHGHAPAHNAANLTPSRSLSRGVTRPSSVPKAGTLPSYANVAGRAGASVAGGAGGAATLDARHFTGSGTAPRAGLGPLRQLTALRRTDTIYAEGVCVEVGGGSVATNTKSDSMYTLNSDATAVSTQQLEQRVANAVKGIAAQLPANCSSHSIAALVALLERIHSELKFIVRRMEKEDLDEDAIADWKFAAMVPIPEPVKCPVKCSMSCNVTKVM